MNATQIQIEQANCQSIIADLYSAAQQVAFDSEGAHDNALAVIEAIEDGRYLEAVMVGVRTGPVGPKPSPDHGATHGIQRVEHGEQKGVAGCLRDGAVQAVVP